MDQLNVYYRALLDYRKQTTASYECSALRSAIAQADVEKDKIVIKRAICSIDEDWVEAIEKGLVHVEKAIKEERQFIRSNGEVIPIEKVKHVSKESVEHLARHSDLITRYEQGEDIIPDKLYTVERLSDYTVYENRFLYMLLCYLRDFISLRYNDILDLTNKYDASLELNKSAVAGKQKLSYKLSMHDVRRDDEYLKENNPMRDVIMRIDLILKAVLAFLATPLMEEVSKVPMIKPPITKTNVLKMNNNFKGALALYDYIIAYDKKGYSIEIKEETISPFRDEFADEFAEVGGLLSFLAYEYSLSLRPQLKEAYALEEELEKSRKLQRLAERVASLKRKLKNSEITVEEYAVELEGQVRALEAEAVRAQQLTEQKAALLENEKQLNKKIASLGKEIDALNEKNIEQAQKHFEEVRRLKEDHENEIHELVTKHEDKIREINAKHKDEIRELNEAYDKHIQELTSKHESEIAELLAEAESKYREYDDIIRKTEDDAKTRIEEERARAAELVGAANAAATEANSNYSKKCDEYDALLEEKRIAQARLKAKAGVDRDYTDKEGFNELEAEYHALTKIYKEQWAKAKKHIRKKHLDLKNIKGQGENDKDSD